MTAAREHGTVLAGANGGRLSFREVVGLLASAQKKAAPGSPPYSVYVNRPAGRLAAAAAFRAGLAPNTVSAISFAFTGAGILLLATAPASGWVGLLVWLALAAGYVLDSADGQVARLTGGGSMAGEWLDHVLDSIKIPSLHLAVLLSLFRNFELGKAWLLVPVGYTIVASVSFFAMILNDQLKARHTLQTGTPVVSTGRRSGARSLLLVPTDYGVLCLLFLTLGLNTVFLALYAAFFAANAAHLLLATRKWFADFQRLTAVAAPVSFKEPQG